MELNDDEDVEDKQEVGDEEGEKKGKGHKEGELKDCKDEDEGLRDRIREKLRRDEQNVERELEYFRNLQQKEERQQREGEEEGEKQIILAERSEKIKKELNVEKAPAEYHARLYQTKRVFRFHMLGLAHLPCSEKYMSCAFTQKIHKLCEMILAKGHQVFLYASEGSDAPCTELIQTHTIAQIRAAYGDDANKKGPYRGEEEIGYDWQAEQFRHDFGDEWPLAQPLKQLVHHRMIAEISYRKKPDDFLLIPMGFYQNKIRDELGMFLQVDSGIGFFGATSTFRVYESNALRHFSRGAEGKAHATDGMHYLRVCANYYRLSDFVFEPNPTGMWLPGQDRRSTPGTPYILFMGRIIHRKGLETVIYATKHANMPLIIAGQASKDAYDREKHTLKVDDSTYQLTPRQFFVGYAGPEVRGGLMSNAVALIAPTYYIEPFGGVAAEAQLCGTPVIATTFGAFTETVEHGRTGFLCSSSNDFVHACKRVHLLDRTYIRKRAKALWSMEAVSEIYEKYWQDLYDVYLSSVEHPMKRKYGFHQIRTPQEEESAGTIDEFFRPRLPYDQLEL